MTTQAAQPDNYIDLILDTRVRVRNATTPVAQALARAGGQQTLLDGAMVWELRAASETELAALLEQLRDMGVLFVNEAAGWPPAAIFANLRERGLVHGSYQELTWRGPGRWQVFNR